MIEIKMSSLGKIILKTLENYYPLQKINLTTDEIDNILDKANINKKNYQKNDIAKIIKILKHHIEISMGQDNLSQAKLIGSEVQRPKFKDLEQDNLNLNHMTQSYLDNISKIREKDLNYQQPEQDILPPSLRVKEFMEKKDIEFKHQILIDSKDRNHDVDTNPSEYSIKLGTNDTRTEGSISRHFEEVTSIELVDVLIKDTSGDAYTGSTDKESIPPYLLLEIDEIGSNLEGTNDFINRAFCRLTYFELVGTPNNDKTKNSLYRHYIISSESAIKYFKPRKNISRLTIRIRNFNGDLYNFGDASDDNDNSCNSFTFRISTLQKNLVSNFIDKSN